MTLVVKGKLIEGMDSDEFLEFCIQNPELRIERNSKGQILFMAPTYSNTGILNSKLGATLFIWNQKFNLGYVFDSSTGFTLPNKAVRSPDASWIEKSRWGELSEKQKKGFAPICPDFIMELLSETDDFNEIMDKMKEWVENGCRLGWLIYPQKEITYVFESGKIQEVDFKQILNGGNVLPEFEINLHDLFSE